MACRIASARAEGVVVLDRAQSRTVLSEATRSATEQLSWALSQRPTLRQRAADCSLENS